MRGWIPLCIAIAGCGGAGFRATYVTSTELRIVRSVGDMTPPETPSGRIRVTVDDAGHLSTSGRFAARVAGSDDVTTLGVISGIVTRSGFAEMQPIVWQGVDPATGTRRHYEARGTVEYTDRLLVVRVRQSFRRSRPDQPDEELIVETTTFGARARDSP